LSVAYGIVSRHNGEITVESEPGEGTTFTITLPVSSEATTKAQKDPRIDQSAVIDKSEGKTEVSEHFV
jgi:hypothetical protein